MTEFHPFAMERMMSKWENVVDYNLSESGVHPATVSDFVDDPAVIEKLLTTKLKYEQANGSVELRERIAVLYPRSDPPTMLSSQSAVRKPITILSTRCSPPETKWW